MSVLEYQRKTHSDIDFIEDTIARDLASNSIPGDTLKPRTRKEQMSQQHQISKLLNQAQTHSKKLLEVYRDSNKYEFPLTE